MKRVNQKMLRVLTAVVLMLGLQQFPLDAVAAQVTTITVYGDETPPRVEGNVTLSMIETATSIINNFADGPLSISNSEDVQLNMQCLFEDSSQTSLHCGLEIERGGETFAPYTIDCTQDGTSNIAGQCTITHDDEMFKEIMQGVQGVNNSNLSGIGASFLSCLQGATGSAQARCAELIDALNDSVDGRVVQILNSLAPLNPEATSDLGRDNLRNTTSVVLSRLGQIRTNTTMASNVSTQMFFANNEWLSAGTRLAANDSLASDVTPGTISTSISDFGKLGFFINLNATDGKYRGGSLSSNSNFTSTMLTLGFDYRVRDDLVTGLAFNVGQSKTKYKSTVKGKLDADSFSFIIYNSFYKDSWYFDSSLTIGGDTFKQERSPLGFANRYDAEFHSMQYNLSLAAGYDFYVQGFGLTPFVQLDVGQLHIDGYKEKDNCVGGCGVALAMDKQKRDIGSLNIGGRFRYIATTSKGVFIPSLTLTGVNDFQNDAQVVTGRFIGLNSNTNGFAIMSEKSDSDYFIIAAGFSMQLKNGNSGFFNLESLQGYDNLDQMRVTLGWRWEL